MNCRLTRILFTLSCVVALSALGAAPAMAASNQAAALPATSCTGSVQASVGSSGVTVTGSVTCANSTLLKLTTSVTASGLTSSVNSLLTALPGLPTPINATIPAVGVTAACVAVVDASTGVTVSASCDA